ncbi:helix-turn-helix transcriptional regulator [Sporosarcina sp. ANT_H38]|uniref:helix-turn-helix domain-containing protein n=1 Tax=Sporosarcina sp. ANT_H38 TaxID=2597358 RepID=UPI0011F16C14|nr:helix-turn-helix transcriptional regulator [Sporosarcina sp. ANT_H38]KAA0941636.1 helix-turn-helix transcriptional regulator [Sporosarcina sp. ANT_H38]
MNTELIENNLGIYLRKRRKEMGMTIQEAADQIGVTQGYVSNVENGKRNPSTQFITKIAELYAEPHIELLKRIDKPTQSMMKTIELYAVLGTDLPGPFILSEIRIFSMKTRLEIEIESGISPMKQRMIENQGINDIELFNKYGQALGLNNLYDYIYKRTKIPYANWWGVDVINEISEKDYTNEYYTKDIVFKKSLETFEKNNVALDKVLKDTEYLYFNDKLLTDAQRGKISRILETLFEDDM